jgi:hypothetical protein
MRSIHRFCAWLQGTPISLAIQRTDWVVPLVQTIHILSIAAVVSAALMIDLRVLGALGRDQSVAGVSRRFRPMIWRALPILLLTGVVLIVGEPSRSLENPVFGLKMALLAAAIAVTLAHQLPLRKDPAYWDRPGARRGAMRLIAALSLLSWSGIVFAGRWIAYSLS